MWTPSLAVLSLVAVPGLIPTAHANSCPTLDVATGTAQVISTTTTLCRLSVGTGAALSAPDGESLTLTVNGVETGSALTQTGETDTAIQPGVYTGHVVLAVTEQH